MGLIGTTSMGVIANLIGPIVLIALCEAAGWRVTFFLTLLPGMIVAVLVFNELKEPDMTRINGMGSQAGSKIEKPTIRESFSVLKNRNVRTSMIFGCFIICWNVGTLTFAPVYLVNVKGFTPTHMSFIMAVFGVGAIVWGMLVPGLSDKIGRKPATIIFAMLSILSPLGLLLSSSPAVIAICIFAGWSGSGVFALHQAAILGESVDARYASTAIASVQMIGEIGGGVIGVAVAGVLADTFGLESTFIFTGVCALAAMLVAFAYYETAPLVLAKRR
jgi:predicted MFS family arabinose efflux permease